ncbi:SCO family protein [Teredinibacter franksiae]|uniref:SCO family protein n=1 Tax=Teredinibacter franksiae TaxID=2761453 RepID=UPI00162A6C16|nr:SCO family protein [Teredinibacter franksiae]
MVLRKRLGLAVLGMLGFTCVCSQAEPISSHTAGATAVYPAVETSDASSLIPTVSFLSNFAGLTLVNQNDVLFDPHALTRTVVLFSFIFTHCSSVCPTQTRSLLEVRNQLPQDVREQVHFVSMSIDPQRDSPEVLNKFVLMQKADDRAWNFLTGDPAEIARLTERLHFFDELGEGLNSKPQIHRTSLWLVDKKGRMLQRYKGDPVDKERIVRELIAIFSEQLPMSFP